MASHKLSHKNCHLKNTQNELCLVLTGLGDYPHKALAQCWADSGPASKMIVSTSAQH